MATPFQDELLALEKSLAGFHPTHYIRESLMARIAIAKEKAEEERAKIAYDLKFTLEEQLATQLKTRAGFHPDHYIVQSIDAKIEAIKVRITQKKTRN